MNYFSKGAVFCLLVGAVAGTSWATAEEGMKQHFKRLDADKNGVITYEEMMHSVHQKFNEFDKNGNNYVELEELPKKMPISDQMKKRMQKHAEKMAKRSDGNDDEMQARMKERFMKKRSRLSFVARLDENGDERLSVEEFAMQKIRRFKTADRNGDGAVTQEEMEKAASHMKRKRHHRGKK